MSFVRLTVRHLQSLKVVLSIKLLFEGKSPLKKKSRWVRRFCQKNSQDDPVSSIFSVKLNVDQLGTKRFHTLADIGPGLNSTVQLAILKNSKKNQEENHPIYLYIKSKCDTYSISLTHTHIHVTQIFGSIYSNLVEIRLGWEQISIEK